jgi:hypothetical protein
MDRDTALTLNRLGREQMKLRLLADIMVDLTVCELEGLDKREYARELHTLLDEILREAGDEAS